MSRDEMRCSSPVGVVPSAWEASSLVLGTARLHYTLLTGRVTTKTDAGLYHPPGEQGVVQARGAEDEGGRLPGARRRATGGRDRLAGKAVTAARRAAPSAWEASSLVLGTARLHYTLLNPRRPVGRLRPGRGPTPSTART
jgi:hypothetical protein